METAAVRRTNRLIGSTSPYLLQHAHNPVDWYPWGAEALEKARREDKPIFLSVGYSACHWCHVMERESFEDEEIARILNGHFVPVKVDREERPDLDEIYMNATLLANQGQGGWPMSVFLTPEQKPFFAGTYFPPGPTRGRPGFKDLLLRIAEIWRDHRDQVEKHAADLVDAVHLVSELEPGGGMIPESAVMKAADALASRFDRSTGGMGNGPNKFPPSIAMALLLRAYLRSRGTSRPKQEYLDLVDLTLDHMARGGIYDQLGGGIHRYSTDPDWLVPHFEKMLYDQAQVSATYIDAYQLTHRAAYAHVARDILEYVLRDLQSPDGGFYSARDADSEGQEGKYYVWRKQAIIDVLGPQLGNLFCSYYDVTDAGNWEGDGINILHVPRDLDTVAKLNATDPDEARDRLVEARRRLLAVRDQRVPPALDDKLVTAWNGLMISTLARGGRVLGEARFAREAGRAADCILQQVTQDGRLLRAYREGRAHTAGYLDDYAFFIEGLLELYETTFEPRWLDEAVRLNDQMIEHFWDHASGGFFFTADHAEPLLVRTKDNRDSEIPSGNSVALLNLLRLAAMLDRADLREKAEQNMSAFAPAVARSPLGFERFLAGVDFYYTPPRELVIAGRAEDPATQALIEARNQVYDPCQVTLLADPALPQAWRERLPLLAGKLPVHDRPAAYVCRSGTCRPPVTQPEELLRELRAD